MKLTVIVFVVIIASGYIVLTAGLYRLQRSFLYFPQPSSPVTNGQKIEFQTSGETLRGWVLNPGQTKAILYYGGNAEQIEGNIPMFESELPDHTVYLINYRGYGASTGKPTEAGLYQDALYIYDQIKSKHDHISLVGRSLGSGVATYVAIQRPIERLTLFTPYDSVENVAKATFWMFPVQWLLIDKYESWKRVKDIHVPTLIFIAEHDAVIPLWSTKNLISKFKPEQAIVVVIPNTDHNSISESALFKDTLHKFHIDPKETQ